MKEHDLLSGVVLPPGPALPPPLVVAWIGVISQWWFPIHPRRRRCWLSTKLSSNCNIFTFPLKSLSSKMIKPISRDVYTLEQGEPDLLCRVFLWQASYGLVEFVSPGLLWLCLTFCDPKDHSPTGSSVLEFSWQECWNAGQGCHVPCWVYLVLFLLL